MSLLPDLLAAVQEAVYREGPVWLENAITHTLRTAPETLVTLDDFG